MLIKLYARDTRWFRRKQWRHNPTMYYSANTTRPPSSSSLYTRRIPDLGSCQSCIAPEEAGARLQIKGNSVNYNSSKHLSSCAKRKQFLRGQVLCSSPFLHSVDVTVSSSPTPLPPKRTSCCFTVFELQIDRRVTNYRNYFPIAHPNLKCLHCHEVLSYICGVKGTLISYTVVYFVL